MAFGKFRKFVRNQGGNVGIIFALAAVPAFALMGGIVDYANIQNEKNRIQAALDAGTLAAMQLKDFNEETAKEKVRKYLESNYQPSSGVKVNFDELEVKAEKVNGVKVVTAILNAKVSTPFWGMVGISKANMKVVSQAKVGAKSLEVVLVLDNTGSMTHDTGSGESKIDALKVAANNLIDTLKEASNYSESVKVGLVPFTNFVRVDTSEDDYWNKSWLSGCKTPRNGHPGTCTSWRIEKDKWEGYIGVREVGSGYDILDEGYDDYPVPAIKNEYIAVEDDGTEHYIRRTVSTIKSLTPLTEDSTITELKAKINAMGATGYTYIPSGLVWGWRLLSAEEPFTEGEMNDDNVKKVIVLMTDGANTCQRVKNGYMRCGYIDESERKIADERLTLLCENIKNEGINIISIGFAVNSTTGALLKNCQNLGYHEPKTTEELKETFKKIADILVRLHISR